MLSNYLAEFIGTALMLALGFGLVANVTLEQSGMKGAGPLAIVFGWGIAVGLPVAIFQPISGAHFNPAVTLSFAIEGSFAWDQVLPYILSQCAGAAVGTLLVYWVYKKQFDATTDGLITKQVFCTVPTIPHRFFNFLSEFVATFILVFCVKSMSLLGDLNGMQAGLWMFAVITMIGFAFGGLTGYAINPVRDNIPRLVYAFLPIKHKANPDFRYSLITIFAPVTGAIASVLTFNLINFCR